MTVLFTCPHCAARTEVEERYLGQTGPCFSCGKTITLPRAAAAGAPLPRGDGRGATSGCATSLVIAAMLLTFVAVAGAVLALLWLSTPSIATPGGFQRAQCSSRLRQLSAALLAYRDQHGCYPPPWLPGADGKPAHSWRVLILPQLGEHALYASYNFSEPWDEPSNQQVLASMPSVFACPSAGQNAAGETNYLAVVGAGAVFDPTVQVRASDVTDDPAATILLVETINEAVLWTEPRDLDLSRVGAAINQGFGVGSPHGPGAHVATADGGARFLPETTPAGYFHSYCTRAGGEIVPLSE